MTDSMNDRDRERLSDFLILLKIWGCWSRGGLPRYKCGLDTSSAGIIPIDPDEAQHIDSVSTLITVITSTIPLSSPLLYSLIYVTIFEKTPESDKTADTARHPIRTKPTTFDAFLNTPIRRSPKSITGMTVAVADMNVTIKLRANERISLYNGKPFS